jgi:spore coat polysaccharide biosynthesis protein SpsF
LKTGIIIQARVGSSRLPFKVLLPFDHSRAIIEIILQMLKEKASNIPVVLATSDNDSDEVLCKVAKEMGVQCFRGPEDDVLERFILTAKHFGFDQVIRICADNPFLDVDGTLKLLDFQNKTEFDYIAYRVGVNTPSIKSHLGFWGELVSINALKRVKSLTNEALYREHVTNYIYAHEGQFKIHWVNAPEIVSSRTDIRLTIDDQEDFNMGKEIFYKMKEDGTAFELENMINFLDRNTQYLRIMEAQIKKYTK